MEEGGGADEVRLALEPGAVGELDVFELLDAFKMAIEQRRVDERRVDERP
jgi:hypothetical protein